MLDFETLWQRAVNHAGGETALGQALPPPVNNEAVRGLTEAHCLAEMTRCVFEAGFDAQVVARKWPSLEAAFLGFDPDRLGALDDRDWAAYATDGRIVRHPLKVAAVRTNAAFVRALRIEHGGIGPFLAAWPPTDAVALLLLLKRRGARLGGRTGQRLLARLGVDGFVLDSRVLAGLAAAGVEGAASPTSKGGLNAIAAAFAAWQGQSGLSYRQLCAVVRHVRL